MRNEPSSRQPLAPVTPLKHLLRSRLVLCVGGFVALLLCLLVLGSIAEEIQANEAIALDALATPLLHSLANPTLDASMNLLTDLGSTIIIAPLFVLALVLLIWRRHRGEAVFLTVAMAGSLVLNQSLKLVFHRPRPQLDWAQVQPDFSFPSGHAMNSLVFYGAIALIVWVLFGHRAGLISAVLAIVLTLLIGTSRVYLGYHYVTDVVGGFLAGAAWLFIVAAAFRGALGLRRRHAEASGP